jgi:hypothetical protein
MRQSPPWARRQAGARAAQEILAESFDPIVELATGADLMPAMVYAQELGAWDYTGMFTAVLRHRVRAPPLTLTLTLSTRRAHAASRPQPTLLARATRVAGCRRSRKCLALLRTCKHAQLEDSGQVTVSALPQVPVRLRCCPVSWRAPQQH